MSGIIKVGTAPAQRDLVGTVAFNYDDVTSKANAYLAEVKAEAAEILAKAQRDATQIRKQAQDQGQHNAHEAAEKNLQARIETQVKQQMHTALPAFEQLLQGLAAVRFEWLGAWEKNAVQLAVAIAEKVIRRELAQQPNITVALVREALELATGSQAVKVYLSPQDHAALGSQIQSLANQIAQLAPAEILPSEAVAPGGCLVQTEYGEIDQRIESQLARIEEELF
jgi:flagellar assembly protein FliH